MQSFLQYRRFRATVQAQVERDGEKARRPQDINTQAEQHLSNESNADTQRFEKDTEKGDLESSAGNSPQRQGESPAQEAAEELPREADDNNDEEVDDNSNAGDESGPNASRALSRATTQQSTGTALGAVLTGIQLRQRSTNEGGSGNVFVVGYEGPDDPNNPHNWAMVKRVRCTFLIAGIGCVVGVASAIDSSALPQASKEFGVSQVVESMATGLFLVGFGAGSLFAGPISETVGRNPVYIATLAIYMCFILGSALAPNIGAQLVFRFIAGFFGSTPLTCAGGSISDLWNPLERVFAFPVFANAAFTGPLLGPIMGGFIAQSSAVSWRWVEWTTLIFSGLILTLVVLFQPETYPPTLLKWKAAHLREITGDDRYRAEIEIREESFWSSLQRALYRPFLLTFREPIIILIALYLTVIYIILFTFLDGYTYVFQETYGISQGLTGLCFVGIIIGLCGASALVPLIYKWAKKEMQRVEEKGGDRLSPEFRLWFSMLGGTFAIPISLFWMAWTAFPSISIWSPLAASVLFGYGILCVFISAYQYIIDTYEIYAASALASVTLIRYVAAGGMVIVGVPFYENEGVHYTLTILACLSALLAPVPFVFYRYGPWIRSKSKFAAGNDM